MADAGVGEETREDVPAASGEGPAGGAVASARESAEPSVAAVMGDLAGDGDGASGAEDAGAGDGARGPDAAGRAGPESGQSPGAGQSAPGPSFDGGTGTGGDDELPVRNPELAPPEPNPENLRKIREASRRQAEDAREDVSEKAATLVRTEVRRILGLDRKPTFEAESVSHVIGLARDGEPVDPELEKELRAELDGLGIDLAGVKLRYETMSEDDRRALTTFEVQQEFLRVVERVDNLATQASVSLGHRIRVFNAQAQDQLKLVAGLTVLIETQQKQVEDLIAGFRQMMQEETESFELFVREQRTKLSGKVQEVLGSFGEVSAEAQSCQKVSVSITENLESAGQVSESLKDEASRVMSELRRVAGEGIAVRRLALLGGVIGSAVGGFFAFVVLLLLWAVTSG